MSPSRRDPTCTCGEPPLTGHYLWCAALRGQREYRPASPARMKPEELSAVARTHPDLAQEASSAQDGDRAALVAVCDALNALARARA